MALSRHPDAGVLTAFVAAALTTCPAVAPAVRATIDGSTATAAALSATVERRAEIAETTTLPVDPPTRVVHPFQAPPEPWSAGHRGVDLECTPGARVLAPGDGTVTFTGQVAGRGVLTIRLRDGRRTSLEPVASTVAVGTDVTRGAVVGAVQSEPTHCAPGTCVHWGMRSGQLYVDPMTTLAGVGPIVLLPSGS